MDECQVKDKQFLGVLPGQFVIQSFGVLMFSGWSNIMFVCLSDSQLVG